MTHHDMGVDNHDPAAYKSSINPSSYQFKQGSLLQYLQLHLPTHKIGKRQKKGLGSKKESVNYSEMGRVNSLWGGEDVAELELPGNKKGNQHTSYSNEAFGNDQLTRRT